MSELTNDELTHWEATVRTDGLSLPWERRSARLLAEVRRLQELDRAMIDKLGEMTERAYRAEEERDEARAGAQAMYAWVKYHAPPHFARSLLFSHPWLEADEQEAAS